MLVFFFLDAFVINPKCTTFSKNKTFAKEIKLILKFMCLNLFLCNISYTNEHKIDLYPSVSVSILIENRISITHCIFRMNINTMQDDPLDMFLILI